LADLSRAVAARSGAKLRIAVVDLGSTSFHMVVVDARASGELERVARRREMLRLGASVADKGRIGKDARVRAIAAACRLRRLAEELGADRILPVGTAALRDAENGAALAARLSEALGAPVRLLSGEEEARLIFAAFRHRVPFRHERVLGVDLGGGSLELAVGDDVDVHWETTLPIGTTRLHGALVCEDPMRRRERKAIRRRVREALAPHRERVLDLAPGACVASGGTLRAIARMLVSDGRVAASGGDQLRISHALLSSVRRQLVRLSHDERLRLPGIKRNRADLLPTGALILETLIEELEVEELVVSDWGLREGAILEALGLVDSRRPAA
jgi:exopolyphosphatase/guanosine-5'-triphosphate,3'-diphosphate pyrophosphatase